MRKSAAIILVFTMFFSFAACKKDDGEVEITKPEAVKTTASVEKTTVSATKEAEATQKPETVKYLAATDEDFEKLGGDVVSVLMNVPDLFPVFGECDDDEFKELIKNSSPEDYKDAYYYNCKSDDALGCAMYIIWNGRMGVYGMDIDMDFEVYFDGAGCNQDGETCAYVPDPEHKFENDPGYIKFRADQVDFVLKEIFCVEPDRAKTSEDFDIESYDDMFRYYYYDGYYYYCYDEGGGGDNPPEVIDYTRQSDGSYIVKLSSYHEEYVTDYLTGEIDEDYIYTIYEASVALKELDGKRVWSFSYIKPVEYVINVQ